MRGRGGGSQWTIPQFLYSNVCPRAGNKSIFNVVSMPVQYAGDRPTQTRIMRDGYHPFACLPSVSHWLSYFALAAQYRLNTTYNESDCIPPQPETPCERTVCWYCMAQALTACSPAFLITCNFNIPHSRKNINWQGLNLAIWRSIFKPPNLNK